MERVGALIALIWAEIKMTKKLHYNTPWPYQSIILHTTTNLKRAGAAQEDRERRCGCRGAQGGAVHCIVGHYIRVDE